MKAPKGTRDILPDEIGTWDHLLQTAKAVFERHGYGRMETPVFEATTLFERAIGKTTDIVNKEMYSFKDKTGRDLTLRPEETASVVRAYIEHRLDTKYSLFKAYYWGPMYRYERPQAGRQREFRQLGVEAMGSSDPALDAEVIEMAVGYLTELGLRDIRLHLNSVGDAVCRPAYSKTLKSFLRDRHTRFCPECQVRSRANPMRVFDCKNPACKVELKKAPVIADYLDEACQDHFAQVQEYLRALNVGYVYDPHLVRGLDYYTRTAFEIKSPHLGAQDAVCAGGRYDELVAQYGGPVTPSIGFAVGMERTILALETERGREPETEHREAVYVIAMGEDAMKAGLKLASQARTAGLTVETDFSGRSLKSRMKLADRSGARYAAIIGDEELRKAVVTVRAMETGEQSTVATEEVVAWLAKRISR